MQQHRTCQQPTALRVLPACVAVQLGTAFLTVTLPWSSRQEYILQVNYVLFACTTH